MENNMFKSGVLLFALGSMSCISLWAQGTVEDYNRAYALREKYNAKHVLYAGVVPYWVDQTSAFWYVRIIRKSKFPQNPKRSVRFSGKRTKRSVQKRKARNTQKAETKVL